MFTNASPKKTRRFSSGFYYASKRDFARCGASCRLRREPRLVNLPANEEKKKASGFRFDEKRGATGRKKT